MLSEAHTEGGKRAAFQFLNQVLSRLTVVLIGLVLVGVAVMGGLGLAAAEAAGHAPGVLHRLADWHLDFNLSLHEFLATVARWRMGFAFGMILMPYLLLVCVVACLLAALNMLGHYAVSGMSQVWLNLSMIISLGVFGGYFGRTDVERMLWQCGGVIFGGMLQVTMPTFTLWREGWRPRWDWTPSPYLREMMRIFLPGLFGASIIQINIMVSRCVAFGLNESATTVLYYSQRLTELPLGMFTIAFATVLFPNIALQASQGDNEGMARTYAQGLRLILAMTVPAALGLVALRVPIVRVLYEHGKFDAQSVAQVAPVLAINALGIPFFSLATLSIRGFYAQKDMRTPVHVAKLDFFLNIGLTLVLMIPFGACGLAMANLASSIFQTVMLQRLLRRNKTPLANPPIRRAVLAIGLAGAGMLAFTVAGWWVLQAGLGDRKISWLLHLRVADLLAVGGLIPVSMIVYVLLLRVAKFEDWPQLRDLAAGFLRPRN
jgi:putative peptidoglycan lipid II flippase